MRTSTPLAFALVLLGLSAAGCTWSRWYQLEKHAPVAAVEVDGDQGNFGSVLVGFHDHETSRVVVTAGPNTKYYVFPIWHDGQAVLGAPLDDGCVVSGCDKGSGTALAGLPLWTRGGDTHAMCIVATAPGDGNVVVDCPDAGRQRVTGVPGVRLGASAASLGKHNDAGVAVFGAPGGGIGGSVYRLVDGASSVEELPLEEGVVDSGDALGDAIAAKYLPYGDTVVAVLASGRSPRRVLVLLLHPDSGDLTVTTKACIDQPGGATGWGTSLAWGDVDGDAEPELFVGADPQASNRSRVVYQYAGTELHVGGCAEPATAPLEIECPEGLAVPCATGDGFGSALATGDVNADGYADLIVGAPGARAGGETKSGAVYVIPGADDGLDPGAAVALHHSQPEKSARLGLTVSTVRTSFGDLPRDEPVAGSPGNNSALVFFCTGLEGDDPEVGERCLPE